MGTKLGALLEMMRRENRNMHFVLMSVHVYCIKCAFINLIICSLFLNFSEAKEAFVCKKGIFTVERSELCSASLLEWGID